ncbi:MAG: hypothetical protein WC663_02405 [Patescibacteria group bacterium]|jgi:hypothetical protein
MSNPEQLMQENLADVKEPQQNVEGLEIAKTPESEKVIESANNLAGKIERDEKVTEGEVDDLREALGQMKFDINGEMMTIEQIKENPEMKINFKIFQEIQSGDLQRKYNVGLTLGITFLPKNIAEVLSHYNGTLNFHRLSFISDSAAEALSHHKGTLHLNKLSSLSDKAAESLSRHQGFFLYLIGLSSLSDKSIESLSHYHGGLFLSGLSTLSDNAAESLSHHQESIYLEGLSSISDAAAESLSHHDKYLGVSPKIQEQINKFKTKK